MKTEARMSSSRGLFLSALLLLGAFDTVGHALMHGMLAHGGARVARGGQR